MEEIKKQTNTSDHLANERTFLTRVSIILCIINVLWIGYNTYQYFSVSKWFESQEIFVMLIFIGLLVLSFSHIIISMSIIISLKKQSILLSGIVLLIIGAISFIALFFHWGALTDILKEYPAGLEINHELKAIWISHFLHFSFIIYSLIYLISVRKNKNRINPYQA